MSELKVFAIDLGTIKNSPKGITIISIYIDGLKYAPKKEYKVNLGGYLYKSFSQVPAMN